MSSDRSDGRGGTAAPPAETGESELVMVQLLGYPLRLGQRSIEHYNDVFREFALLASDDTVESEAAPRRLLDLIDALGRRYPRQQAHEEEREAALARGERSADFVISVPRSAGEASATLDLMLDETDEFCRAGKLLTLEAAEDVLAFRRWYLQQMTVQASGGPATPWSGDLD